jgi:hypothetical protein
MSVYNPWTRHYQIEWENRAANPDTPMWARIICLAYGRHAANGHAIFHRGQLTWLLGTPPKGDKPFKRAQRQTVNNAIQTAVRYGWLDSGSCLECLVVPGHAIQGPQGKADAPCPVHERKAANNREAVAQRKLTVVS